MPTRRDALKILTRLFLWIGVTTGFWFSKVPAAMAKIKKRILGLPSIEREVLLI